MTSTPESSMIPDVFPLEERQAVYRAIYARRDIRHFRGDPIPDQVLARIIKAAHQGPSVGFMQPWDFMLIRSLDVRNQVKELFERERQAAACYYDEPRRSHYLSLKLEGILESPVNLCITCDPTRAEEVLGRTLSGKPTFTLPAARCKICGWQPAPRESASGGSAYSSCLN